LLITALAYLFARRHARNPRFTFGTGKIGDLAGFASAIVLAIVALLIGWESLLRLYSPIAIDVPQAIAVAVIGLAVNLASAWLLRDDHDRDHDHHHHHHGGGHDHDHRDPHAGGKGDQDNNLRAAYLHVLADALTSVLAIAALLLAGLYGWLWLDPVIGLVGAIVIVRWSWGLMRDAGAILLDCVPAQQQLSAEIRRLLETGGDEITDLHVWRLGPGHHAAIVALASPQPHPPAFYRRKLAQIHDLSHITIEVEGRAA